MKNEYILQIGQRTTVSFDTKRGAEIYRRSMTVLLQCAISELFPDFKVQIGQSLMNGYYFEMPSDERFPPHFIRDVTKRIRKIVKNNDKFHKEKVDRSHAVSLYKKKGRHDKARAVASLDTKKIDLIFLRDYFDYMLAECAVSTGCLKTFKLIRYKHGFILQFPVYGNAMKLPDDASRQEKLYRSHIESRNWNRILGIKHVPDLNRAIADGSISTIIKVQEAFHEKKIAYIADKIKSFFPKKRIIFVAGPSSSGKTTFLKRLGVQIRANGMIPEEICLDDYFVQRSKTPRGSDGEYDFESVEALDLDLFSRNMSSLLSGRHTVLPKFDFKRGCRECDGRGIKLSDNSVMLVEGIHGLNPAILQCVELKADYKIFVSALTQLCIDNDTRIFTSDSRLMRRIIRDHLFRGYSAVETINRFPDVRRGEDKNIFPYQDNADVFFNSSLIYEQAVLKPFISKLLKDIKRGQVEYYEANRLLKYIDFFDALSPDEVPQVSILREFVGESAFRY